MIQIMQWELCKGGLITFEIKENRKTKVTITGTENKLNLEYDCYADALRDVCIQILMADGMLRRQEENIEPSPG